MNVVVIKFNEIINKWQVLWSWTCGEPIEFELGDVQSAIDWCKSRGYLISWR